MTDLHIIITGDPVGGFSYIGPFPDREAAIDHASRECEADWWLAPLVRPEHDQR